MIKGNVMSDAMIVKRPAALLLTEYPQTQMIKIYIVLGMRHF